ncbi:MAG: S8 family serine peptidase [Butyrivibrio sp.]|nr:S8 family serine peptidase [Butyrivibrio sp.]
MKKKLGVLGLILIMTSQQLTPYIAQAAYFDDINEDGTDSQNCTLASNSEDNLNSETDIDNPTGTSSGVVDKKYGSSSGNISKKGSNSTGEDYFFYADNYSQALEITEDYDVELDTFEYGIGTIVDTEGILDIPEEGDGTIYHDYELTLESVSDNYDADVNEQWHIDFLDMASTWKKATGSGIKVAVIDSGISNGNSGFYYSDIVSSTSIPSEFYGDGSEAIFDVSNEGIQDNYGHGTHVAGIIGAYSDDSSVMGIAPECTLYTYKAFDVKKTGAVTGKTSWVIKAIQQAIDDDVDIINMSIGGSTSTNTSLEAALQVAYENGIILVCAAGNLSTSSPSRSPILYPGSSSYTIAVTAGTLSDDTLTIASYSKYGDGVDYIAPGTAILSTYKNTTSEMSGTSMATPMVSGEIALILSILSGSSKYSDKATRMETVYSILQDTAVDLGDSGKDEIYGYGMISPLDAVTAAKKLVAKKKTDNSSSNTDTEDNTEDTSSDNTESSTDDSSDSISTISTSQASAATSASVQESNAASTAASSSATSQKGNTSKNKSASEKVQDILDNMPEEDDEEMYLQDEATGEGTEGAISSIESSSDSESTNDNNAEEKEKSSNDNSSEYNSGQETLDENASDNDNGILGNIVQNSAFKVGLVIILLVVMGILFFLILVKKRKDEDDDIN